MISYKKILIFISPLLLVQLLVACSSDSAKNEAVNSDNISNKKQIETKQLSGKYSNLKVNHTCIGCGRCAMIDREHFVMQGRIAQVVSEQNLESMLLEQAVRICPTSAIELS